MNRRKFIFDCATGICVASLSPSLINKAFSKQSNKLWKWSQESYYYKKLSDGNVQCQLCPNECQLEEGERSYCRTRTNYNGKLYALSYGNPCSVHVDPIEKKPLLHFLPTTTVLSIATAGCNFRCLNCQNWEISQKSPEETENSDLFPKDVIVRAKTVCSSSIAYTYSGPIAFYEYMYDTAKLANEQGIMNVLKDQAYFNPEPLNTLCKFLDACSIDLKYFSDELYQKISKGDLKTVLNSLKIIKENNVWLEIVHLIIPTINDDMDMFRDMSKWIVNNLGVNYPLHLSRFYPMYKMTHLPPTPVKTLEKAHKIAKDEGLNYVYIGNVPGSQYQNTICPKCERIIVKRVGYTTLEINLDGNTCKYCGHKIAGKWS